jgi:hypothetical protein
LIPAWSYSSIVEDDQHALGLRLLSGSFLTKRNYQRQTIRRFMTLLWTLSSERDLGRLEAQVKRKGSRLKTAAEIGLAVGAVTLPANANFGLIAGNRA